MRRQPNESKKPSGYLSPWAVARIERRSKVNGADIYILQSIQIMQMAFQLVLHLKRESLSSGIQDLLWHELLPPNHWQVASKKRPDR